MTYCVQTVQETGNPLIQWVNGSCSGGAQPYPDAVPPGFAHFLQTSGQAYEVTPQNGGGFFSALKTWLGTVTTSPVTTTVTPSSIGTAVKDIPGDLKNAIGSAIPNPFSSVTDFLNWLRGHLGADFWKGAGLLIAAGVVVIVGGILWLGAGRDVERTGEKAAVL